ncbi:hypothetical protein ACE1TI_13305 [Alteribacillus sp. JSM 102045]
MNYTEKIKWQQDLLEKVQNIETRIMVLEETKEKDIISLLKLVGRKNK